MKTRELLKIKCENCEYFNNVCEKLNFSKTCKLFKFKTSKL